MAKRGRKSAAELSVVRVAIDGSRPPPPDGLTDGQARAWREIVESLPADWISPAQEPLLAAYCRHVSAADQLAEIINKFEPDLKQAGDLQRLNKILAMRERETKALSSIATRMRLTSQSQMHPRTAARAIGGANGGPKPWDDR
jgi:phage terminase small subunit